MSLQHIDENKVIHENVLNLQACSRKKPSLYACSFYMAYCWAPYPSIHTGIFIGAASSGISRNAHVLNLVMTVLSGLDCLTI